MYSMNYYGYVSDDYLCHYGVKGMKWYQHLMAKVKTAAANRAATNRAVKAEKKKILDSYKVKDPAYKTANSAAKLYYRSTRAEDARIANTAREKGLRKEALLTDEQIKAGRYRVAHARNIRRKVASTSVAALAGVATATVATGGMALAATVAAAGITGVAANGLSSGWYYAKEAKLYGTERAKLQAKVAVAKKEES